MSDKSFWIVLKDIFISLLIILITFLFISFLQYYQDKWMAKRETDIIINTDENFDDLVGMEDVKNKFRKIISDFKDGTGNVKGILLYGPPGYGKTVLARKISGEFGIELVSKSGPSFIDKYYGESEKKIREFFKTGETGNKKILFIDECESLLSKRNEQADQFYGSIVNQFLECVDSVRNKKRSNYILILATNFPNRIDPAAIRPGRIDLKIEIPKLKPADRIQLFKKKMKFYVSSLDKELIDLGEISPARIVSISDQLNSLNKIPTNEELRQAYMDTGEPYEKLNKGQEGFNLSNIIGMEQVKSKLRYCLHFMNNRSKLPKEATMPKGMLLVGPPGTGKSHIARCLAGEAKVPFLSYSGSEFSNKWVGEGQKMVGEMFEKARNYGKCIIFIDEIDALCSSRNNSFGNDERNVTLNRFLSEMDGMTSDSNSVVLIIGATNCPDRIDAAVRRPGRFDQIVEVPLPKENEIIEITNMYLKSTEYILTKDVETYLKRLAGEISPAMIKRMCEEMKEKKIEEAIKKYEKYNRTVNNVEYDFELRDFIVAYETVSRETFENYI
jgi:transitional endoplasmic reticulum ATPase